MIGMMNERFRPLSRPNKRLIPRTELSIVALCVILSVNPITYTLVIPFFPLANPLGNIHPIVILRTAYQYITRETGDAGKRNGCLIVLHRSAASL